MSGLGCPKSPLARHAFLPNSLHSADYLPATTTANHQRLSFDCSTISSCYSLSLFSYTECSILPLLLTGASNFSSCPQPETVDSKTEQLDMHISTPMRCELRNESLIFIKWTDKALSTITGRRSHDSLLIHSLNVSIYLQLSVAFLSLNFPTSAFIHWLERQIV